VKHPRFLVLLAACAVLVASCSSGSDTLAQKESATRPAAGSSSTGGSQTRTVGALDWKRCKGELTSLAGLQCATLAVPVDPKRPSGATVELALARKPATGPAAERIGSLVMNPGGPGGSGLEFLANAAGAFPDSLTKRFDLVSFDPRGVGESDPVRCLDDEQKDEQLTGDLSPDTPQERARLEADQKTLREGCERRNPKLITHMSTADVAADLEQIRVALGDDKLNYLGYSYGTAIGAAYATAYPAKVRAMVLDGSVSPSSTPTEEALAQATGFERTLANFVKACNAAPSCALAPDAAGAIAQARASLETNPVVVKDKNGDRTLGPDLFDYGLATALYDSSTWGPTAQAVKDLRSGGAETILALVDRQTGRKPNGTFDNSSDAQVMVNCADVRERPTEAEAQAAEARIAQAAPTFGALLGTGLTGCNDWPKATEPTPVPDAAGAAPILVVGTVGDPATPYEWAQQMASTLKSGVLLTYEGDGHTAFLRGGPCIEDAVVAYLVDLKVPAVGTRCPAVSDSSGFGDVKKSIVDELTKSGLPQDVATCIVNGMEAEVGAARFNQLILEGNQEEITKLASAQTLKCVSGKN
jgi:pimeloyl-ACP methyl ester carboxylesterase